MSYYTALMCVIDFFEASILRIKLSVGDDYKEFPVSERGQLVKALYDYEARSGCFGGRVISIKILVVMSDGEYWQSVPASVQGVWGVDSQHLWSNIVALYDQCVWLASIDVRVDTARHILSKEKDFEILDRE